MYKWLKYIISVILCQIVLMACTDKYSFSEGIQPSLTPRYIHVTPLSFFLNSYEEYTDYLEVESLDTPWKFDGYSDWILLQPSTGRESATVTMNICENENSENRTSFFYFRSDLPDFAYEMPITVTQPGSSPYINVEDHELEFGGGGGTKTIAVKSNSDWAAASSATWLTLTKNENGTQLTVTAEENPSSSYRNATVYLSYENKNYLSINVYQYPSDISVSDMKLLFDNTASKYDLTVTSEAAWTAIVSDSWIQVSPSEGGAGEVKMSIEAALNGSVETRRGYVTIRTGSENRLQIEIEQKGLYFTTEKMLSFTSRATSTQMSIESNINWEVSYTPDWVTVSPSSGSGDSEVTMSVSENSSTYARNGEIVFSSPGLDISFTTSVIQAGKTLTPGATVLQFSDKAESRELEITADGEWTSETSDDWISVSPESGYGDATVSVTVTENTSSDVQREGSITYHFGEKEIKVTVLQQSKYFEVEDKAFNFISAGGSHVIYLGSNQPWAAKVEGKDSSTWLSLSSYSGDREAEITMVAAPNNMLEERKATVTITPQYSQAAIINVTQKGMYLKVSVTNLSFFSRGGVSDPIMVDTDGAYSVATSDSWLTVNKTDNSFTVTAEPNDATDTREGKVTVSLLGLSSGSYEITIPVTQVGHGGSFVIEGFPGDVDWTGSDTGEISIRINGYTQDKNWNTDPKYSLSITVDGFSSDSNWNTDSKGSADIGINGFSSNQNWNNAY